LDHVEFDRGTIHAAVPGHSFQNAKITVLHSCLTTGRDRPPQAIS
jgi:hypothetical protein